MAWYMMEEPFLRYTPLDREASLSTFERLYGKVPCQVKN